MSGIAGVYNLDGRQVERTDLEQMVERMAQRGPDGTGIWNIGSIGLCHRMLWTTPESLKERLPLVYREGDLVLTADARIDNRLELIATLGINDRKPVQITDSELILAAYEKWGEECPEKLIGDFAFAIWDSKKQKLFAARDPMGLKPFYYYHFPGRLMVFASQIQPMFCISEVPRQLYEPRVAFHLSFIYEDRKTTFYQDIYQLPAAHCLVINPDGMEIRRYWDLDTTREIHLPSDEAYAEAFLEIFTEAVRCRTRSAFPVGSLLSGGLDSSSIVAVANKVLSEENGQHPLHTFSAIFPTLAKTYPMIDERPWIDEVVATDGLAPHYIHADLLDPLDAITFNDDEPIPVPNMWLDWGCFESAHNAGLRVVLSGFDGDTAVSYGYGYLAELARSFHWKTLFDEANIKADRLNWSMGRVIKEDVLKLLIPPTMLRYWRKVRRRQPPSKFPFDPPINPTFAQQVGLNEQVQALTDDGSVHLRSPRDYHRFSLLSGQTLYGPELLDKAGAAWFLEPRLPYFDRRLVEFLLALPTGQKLHQGRNRYVVRRAMQGILPSEVQWRQDKGNLSPNIRRGLIENHALLDQVFLHEIKSIETFVDLPKVRAAYDRFSSQPMQSSVDDIFTMVVTLTFALWLPKSGLEY